VVSLDAGLQLSAYRIIQEALTKRLSRFPWNFGGGPRLRPAVW